MKKNKEITQNFNRTDNLLPHYFKDSQFNAKKETLKEQRIIDFFKVSSSDDNKNSKK